MDFSLPYTPEQETFRKEVRAWLDENTPEEMKLPIDPNDTTQEMRTFWAEKHLELGRKGWLYPTYPKEYGGGGLSADHETILDEEFARARAPRSYGNTYSFGSIMVWGTEEQKQKFLVPFMKGEKKTHQRLTEPQGGADLANVQGRAVRDGDDWLLTGQNVFISCWGDEDYYPGVMMTDPEAPRHRNLGFFMVPNNVEGLEIRAMDLLPSSGRSPGPGQKAIFMDNVRVPADHMIGGDHQGWQVMQTLLEAEHGGRGRAFPRDDNVDSFVHYVKETDHDGGKLGCDPIVQQSDHGRRNRRPRAEPVPAVHLLDVPEPHGDEGREQLHQRPQQRVRPAELPKVQGRHGAVRFPQHQGARRSRGRNARGEPALHGGPAPRRRQHQHRQGYPGAAHRHQPHPGEGGSHRVHGDQPRQLA